MNPAVLTNQAKWRKASSGLRRNCLACGTQFSPTNRQVKKGGGYYCSSKCGAGAPKGPSTFQTPESSQAERIRANGLVNKRLLLGWFTPPPRCQLCPAIKVESHHPDYSKPDEVIWLCRSHHILSHHHPEILAGLPVFVCADYRERPHDLTAAIAALYAFNNSAPVPRLVPPFRGTGAESLSGRPASVEQAPQHAAAADNFCPGAPRAAPGRADSFASAGGARC